MMTAICERARHGGLQAVAAPRSRGKTELLRGLLVFLVLAGLVRFPLPVAATTPLAHRTFRDFKKKLEHNQLLYEDFPEVCHPIRCLEGAPQRAGRQHVDGVLTQIVWSDAYISLPIVEGSPYGGVKMSYFGLDAAFRGVNIDGMRPDFVPIDDPETRESARSILQIEDREAIIEQDIAGLGSHDARFAIVVLSTVQNNYCLSARLTDPKVKPAWNGRRFGMVVSWPVNMEQWQEYIVLRKADQVAGQEYGPTATAFYLANRDSMDRGVEMITDRYKPVITDGQQQVHSAIQQAFNQIADTSLESYKTEFQNDPPAEESIETRGLTAARVLSRVGEFEQGVAPDGTELRTVGMDLGNYVSHWTDIGWSGAAAGSIIDYGTMETYGVNPQSTKKAIETAILAALEVWADDVVAKINPLLALIDSGSGEGHTEAVYEFCRRRGAPFFPSKGFAQSAFHIPLETDTKKPFLEAWAHRLDAARIWLYNVNSEYWKRWVHQQFLTAPWDDSGQRVDGSFLLFDPAENRKRHLTFANHIVAEEEQLIPVFGKPAKRQWFVKNKNNHWLDATALASAGAGCVGMRLIEKPPQVQVIVKPLSQQATNTTTTDPSGRLIVARKA